MSKITVLGGCGTVGSFAVKALSSSGVFSEIVVADKSRERGERLISTIGDRNISFEEFDASDEENIKTVIKGSSVVLNAVGPFYEFGPRILKSVIEERINYVDVCDDFDATKEDLLMDEDAKEKGISALIGMGSSPGFANVLVRFASDFLFDQITTVDIYHAHGGEKNEGPAVIKHRIHSMSIGVPVFLDGELKTVKFFGESAKALEEETYFQGIGTYRVYVYPHPETITLPKYIKGLKRVTNLGLVLPPKYAELIKGIVRLGITSEEPIRVNGQDVIPHEFAISFILHERDRLVKEAGITEPTGCLKIVMKGKKNGEENTYIFSAASKGQGMAEGTGIPAALGAMLMETGKIKEKGVFPPEKGVNPIDMLKLLKERIKTEEKGTLPISVEHIDRNGKKEAVDPALLLSSLM